MPKTPRDLTYLRWNGEKASNMTHNNSLNPLDSDLSLNVHIHFKIPESSLVLINLLASISYTFTVLPFFIVISSESEISRIFPIAGLACAGATSSGNGSSSSTYGVGLTGGSWQRGGKTSGEFSWGMWCKKNGSTINCSENSCPSSFFSSTVKLYNFAGYTLGQFTHRIPWLFTPKQLKFLGVSSP